MTMARNMSRAKSAARPVIVRQVEEFLAMLAHERNASPHTVRAYERELHSFADFVVEKFGAKFQVPAIEHQHIRA